TPIRLGRQAQWLQADLSSDGRLLARATVLRIARAEIDLPPTTPPQAAPPGPDGLDDFVFPFFQTDEGYHRAVDIRIAEGEWAKGPCTAWMRSRYPFVEGAPTSPLENLMILADATNGIAPVLPVDRFAFVNADLTVHLLRPPVGEWLALSARARAEPIGAGLVQSQLFDRQGELGRCLLSLVVRPR